MSPASGMTVYVLENALLSYVFFKLTVNLTALRINFGFKLYGNIFAIKYVAFVKFYPITAWRCINITF